MRLLLDQGLPRSALVYLRQCQIETSHVAELGMNRASDSQILGLPQTSAVRQGTDAGSSFHDVPDGHEYSAGMEIWRSNGPIWRACPLQPNRFLCVPEA